MRPIAVLVVLILGACTTATSSTAPPRAPSTTPAPSSIGTTTTATSTTATSTTPTTSTTTTTTTVPERPRTISMAFSGDILPHSPLWRRAARNHEPAIGFDFRPMLAGLADLHDSVDLAVCHLETPIAPVGEELSTSPFYGVPAEVVDAIAAAGFDRCSTASNHAADRGTDGVDRTVDVLEAAGIEQSGMARRPAEIEPGVFDVDGITVSHLSYTFSYNGLSFPEGEDWRSAVIDPERIVADARTARTLGADVVIASMHWGAEGAHTPTGWQREIADEITADGLIDLVVGHHAHVLQPIELVNDTWVLYGLGNILSNLPTSSRWPAASQDAAVVTLDITVDERDVVTVANIEVHPTWVDQDDGWIVRLVDDELARTDIGAGRRGRLERSRERTERVLGEFMAPAG
jgi:poly-gamma-glutamate capsule biosynthesis protein CapA/YwtB (metallophosphatase superfamily)